jgi:hypothetical protein
MDVQVNCLQGISTVQYRQTHAISYITGNDTYVSEWYSPVQFSTDGNVKFSRVGAVRRPGHCGQEKSSSLLAAER